MADNPSFKVHIPTLEAQQKYFKEHREEILSSKHRYAVVSEDEIKLYNKKEDIYKNYPNLSPDAPTFLGTLPKLIDIGKETNSLEYRIERNRQRKEECEKNLIRLSRRKRRVDKIGKGLLNKLNYSPNLTPNPNITFRRN